MSNYVSETRHPETGEIQSAEWIDDHFGRHRYGVRFPDGKLFRADTVIENDQRFAEKHLTSKP